jgi:hypothetical protein
MHPKAVKNYKLEQDDAELVANEKKRESPWIFKV